MIFLKKMGTTYNKNLFILIKGSVADINNKYSENLLKFGINFKPCNLLL
jgi:hypothetical protein